MMQALVFYVCAGLFLALSVLLLWRTSRYSQLGGNEYERTQMRRMAGTVLIVLAAITAVVGWIIQTAQNIP